MLFDTGSFPQAARFDTKQALLLIDFQNDFLLPNGNLHVANTADFIPKLPSLVSKFRGRGDVIWTRTEFQQCRPITSTVTQSYAVILKDLLRPQTSDRDEPDTQDLRPEDGDGYTAQNIDAVAQLHVNDPEAFLSLKHDDVTDQCCRADSQGSHFPQFLTTSVDHQHDTILVKSHYSAFEGTTLLQTLRTRLVTKLYVGGSLSNISVYATVLDAVMHGLEVVLIEDCLGYRDDRCHFEAMRQMADNMCAEGVDHQELMDDLAGLLGDVVKESDYTTRFEVSVQRPGPELATSRLQNIVNDWITTVEGPGPTSAPAQNQAGPTHPAIRAEEAGSSHESILRSDSSGQRSLRLGTPELTPPRKRSTSDLELEGPEHKFLQHSSQRRSSQDTSTHRAPKPKSKSYRTGARRPTKVLEEHISAAHATALAPVAQSKPTRDMPDPKDRSTDSEELASSSAPRRPSMGQRRSSKGRQKKSSSKVILGPGDRIGEGDSHIFNDLLAPAAAMSAFAKLKTEVKWQKMCHRTGEVPRLVAVQGETDKTGKKIPVYRHPVDESPELLPFSETVEMIRIETEKAIGHPLNHVLIQLYRNSEDNISEHSDKTLDIVRGSSIVNYSCGALRTMTLRTKKSAIPPLPSTQMSENGMGNPPSGTAGPVRLSQRVPLSHNSLFVLGQATNQHWLHSIRADKRPIAEKSAEELDYNGERISLTFRHIGTFIDTDRNTIWGQGATGKTRETARNIQSGVEADKEGERMIRAFGQENHLSREWSWEEWYGGGFDVVNFETKADHAVKIG